MSNSYDPRDFREDFLGGMLIYNPDLGIEKSEKEQMRDLLHHRDIVDIVQLEHPISAQFSKATWRGAHSFSLLDEVLNDGTLSSQIDKALKKISKSGTNLSNCEQLVNNAPLPCFKIRHQSSLGEIMLAFSPSIAIGKKVPKTYPHAVAAVESLVDVCLALNPKKDRVDVMLALGRATVGGGKMDVASVQNYSEVVYSNFQKNAVDDAKLEELNKLGPNFLRTYLAIQFMVLNRPTIFHIAKTREASEFVSNPKSPKKRPKRQAKLVRNIYIDDDEFKKFMKKRQYTCECWGVIGHERHLKSGKIVKVRPYRKGPKRDDPSAYVPKRYVPPEDNQSPESR